MTRARILISAACVAIAGVAACSGDATTSGDAVATEDTATAEDTRDRPDTALPPADANDDAAQDAAADTAEDTAVAPQDTAVADGSDAAEDVTPPDTLEGDDTSPDVDESDAGDTSGGDSDAPPCVPVADDDATLDGVDDDCDGLVDEDAPQPLPAGPDPIELRLDPDLLFVGDPGDVSVLARVTGDGEAPDHVRLERLEADGGVTALLDIYDVAADAAGNVGPDGVYEATFSVPTDAPSGARYRVVATTADGDLVAAPRPLTVLAPLPDGWLDAVWDVMEGAQAELAAELDLWPQEEALVRAAWRLQGQPGVLAAVADPVARGVTVAFTSGVVAALGPVGRDGERSGPDPVGPPAPGPIEIGDRGALLLRMWSFPNDESAAIAALFDQTPSCRPALQVSRQDLPSPMLDQLIHLSDHAVVHIASHGFITSQLPRDLWRDGLCEAMGLPPSTTACEVYQALFDQRRWDATEGVIAFDRVQRGDGLPPARVRDLLTGRLGLWFSTDSDPQVPNVAGLEYLVFPDFISHYNAPFPDSIVFGAFCHSLQTGRMAEAFLGRGAGVYLGYNNAVIDTFAYDTALAFYTCLAADPGRTVGDCFVPGQGHRAGGSPWAAFLMLGDPNVRLARPDLANRSFEGAYHLRAVGWNDTPALGWRVAFWEGNNTLRVREAFGEHTPVDGEHLAVVGNFGPGTTGRFEQRFCLPPGSGAITVSYALYTDDCGAYAEDLAQGSVVVGEGADAQQMTLFNHSVNAYKACKNLDFHVVDGMSFPSGAIVRATSWMEAAADVSALTTGDTCVPAKLFFSVVDRRSSGGGITLGGGGDTALVLDDIHVVSGQPCTSPELLYLDDNATATPCNVTTALGTTAGHEVCIGPGGRHCAGPALLPEACDFLDNDGDGATDEGAGCMGLNCSPTAPYPCGNLLNPCMQGVCDPVRGCVFTVQDGVECDDGRICTGGDTCHWGHCVATPIDVPCDDGRECTIDDHCASGRCVGAVTAGADCEDAQLCTAGDTCDPWGNCIGGPALSACDDLNPCTTGDACSAQGQCTGTAVVCDDQDPCTRDFCDFLSGCESEPIEGCTAAP